MAIPKEPKLLVLGTSFIEVMISLLLLSILLLGLDALQLTALNQAKNTYFFSVAMQQINQAAERLMACQENNCDEEILIWNQQNNEVLPQGKGKIRGHYPDYQISLWWGNSKMQSCQQNKIGRGGREGCLQLGVHF